MREHFHQEHSWVASPVPRQLPDFILEPWRTDFSSWLWDKIWEWPGDEASSWLEPSLSYRILSCRVECCSEFWTVYKQTVCTRLPCSLLTQQHRIKANIYAVICIIVHADSSMVPQFGRKWTRLIIRSLYYVKIEHTASLLVNPTIIWSHKMPCNSFCDKVTFNRK